jgi:hypothetical protein
MKATFFASVLALALVAAGCDWDDDDYSYYTENCTSVDLGGGEEYELCCRLKCAGEYDYDDDHFSERCSESYSCESSTGDDCPREVVDEYGYPDCIY